jgi:hypothetical protein
MKDIANDAAYAEAMRQLEKDPNFKRMNHDDFTLLSPEDQIKECLRVLEYAGLIFRTGEMRRSPRTGELQPVYVSAIYRN